VGPGGFRDYTVAAEVTEGEAGALVWSRFRKTKNNLFFARIPVLGCDTGANPNGSDDNGDADTEIKTVHTIFITKRFA
jgi:hypothetical protein